MSSWKGRGIRLWEMLQYVTSPECRWPSAECRRLRGAGCSSTIILDGRVRLCALTGTVGEGHSETGRLPIQQGWTFCAQHAVYPTRREPSRPGRSVCRWAGCARGEGSVHRRALAAHNRLLKQPGGGG